MSLARRNIVANLVGGIWITALTLAITPLQVRLLGIEAYGLIGFIATLQIVFTMFDFGLSSTVTREIASATQLQPFTSDRKHHLLGLCRRHRRRFGGCLGVHLRPLV